MNVPDRCLNIEDIRAEIDRIDAQIIIALGKRFEYVKIAAKFKKSEVDVKAPERLESSLESLSTKLLCT